MMTSFSVNDPQFRALVELDGHFQKAMPRLSKLFTVEYLTNEANALNYFESSIPKDDFLDIHLDMIFTPGAVSEYHKSIGTGRNQVLEAARKAFPNMQHITESYDAFKNYVASMISEAMALGEPVEAVGDVGAALGGATTSSSGGFWAMCKGFLSAMTEGGSIIGIIQFVIDIIGAFGDYVLPGLGVVADLVNAAIYAFRGQWLLCAISVIAAVVIGAGDTLKLFKGVAKAANPIFVKLVKGNVDEAIEVASKSGIKQGSSSVSFLKKIGAWIGSALATVSNLLGKAMNGLGSWVGWVPGLGGALKWVFESVGSLFTRFGKYMNEFCDGLRGFEKGLSKRALDEMGVTLKKADDFKLSDDGTELIGYNAAGKEIGRVPSSHFDKLDIRVKYGTSAKETKELFSNPEEYVKYLKTVRSKTLPAKFNNRFYRWLEKTGIAAHGANRIATTKRKLALFLLFLGKQVYKVVNQKEWEEGKGWPETELKAHGSAAFNSWIDEKIAKKREEEGVPYLPALELDTRDQEVVDHIVDYQNNYAKLTGQPTITHLVYDKYGNEDDFKEFDEFFEDVEEGKVEAGEKGDKVDSTLADDLKKEQATWKTEKGTGEDWREIKPYGSTETSTEKSKPKLESRSVFSFSEFKNK